MEVVEVVEVVEVEPAYRCKGCRRCVLFKAVDMASHEPAQHRFSHKKEAKVVAAQ
jgi:hypothetical protein